MAGKRNNLLLCFDAFGTLYTPRAPIAAQYGAVARSMGIKIEDEEVMAGFKKAFKEESAAHPNFGKAMGMGSTKWWTNVITKTFEQHVSPQPIPHALAPTLIDRFNGSDGYTLYPDVKAYLERLRPHRQSRSSASTRRIVVGVITNSDDRTPDVLTSLGLSIGARRFNSIDSKRSVSETATGIAAQQDIDFVICSYDVGFEKPDRRVFDAAKSTLREILAAEKGMSSAQEVDLGDWDLVYVGDEIEKDGVGATQAGWNAVVVDRSLGDGDAISLKRLVKGAELDVVSDFGAFKNLQGTFPLICGD